MLKVLGKSVGLCKTTKRKDQLYISLLVSVWTPYERFFDHFVRPKSFIRGSQPFVRVFVTKALMIGILLSLHVFYCPYHFHFKFV